jgi:hypothetical protein
MVKYLTMQMILAVFRLMYRWITPYTVTVGLPTLGPKIYTGTISCAIKFMIVTLLVLSIVHEVQSRYVEVYTQEIWRH